MNWSERYASSKEIDLRWTVVHHPVPDFVINAASKTLSSSNLYPDHSKLKNKLAKKHKINENMLTLSAGADHALMMLGVAYGDSTHIFTPTYAAYTESKNFGKKITEHYSLVGDSYSISTDKIPGATLIFLTNPNNPAGFTERKTVLDLVKNNPQAKVVVDEVYGELSPEYSVLDEVKNHKNLIVVRSFSKAYALAGFRIGYIIAHEDTTKKLDVDSLYFAVSKPSCAAAIAALDNESYYQNIREDIHKERDLSENYFRSKGINIIPSKINSLLLKFTNKSKATEFVNKCKNKNILVDQGNCDANVGLTDSFVRIAVGTSNEMKKLREAI